MRIIVVGGGIGGLALAAGLRRNGFEVVVYERDTDVTATGGYHITLDGRAQAALRGLVAPEVFERVLASASALRLRERDAMWDRRGRLLGHGRDLGDDPSVDIDRITLRTVLADAVGADLRLGRSVTGVGRGVDGRPPANRLPRATCWSVRTARTRWWPAGSPVAPRTRPPVSSAFPDGPR